MNAPNESVFLQVGPVAINDNNDIFFCGHLSPDKSGIFKILDDEIIPLAMIGDSVNGLESTIENFNCQNFLPISLNNNGVLVATGRLSDERNTIFRLNGNTIEPMLLEGDPFPVVNKDALILSTSLPSINDKGEVVFRATYYTDTSMTTLNSGVFLLSEGEIIPVKLPRQEAPGTGGNVFSTFHFEPPALGNNSDVVFYGDYLSPEAKQPPGFIPWLSEFGLFLWSKGNVLPIALTGEPAPGTNGIFRNINGTLGQNALNDFGEVIFEQSGGNKTGIFLFSDSNVIPVILGKILPRYKILNPVENALPSNGAINNQGDIAFTARIGPPFPANNLSNSLFMAIKEDTAFTILKK